MRRKEAVMHTRLTPGRKYSVLTLVVAFLCVLAIQLAHTQGANAAVYGYCENVHLGGGGTCQEGIVRNTYQAYAWGDQHSVCVGLAPLSWTQACSGGPGQGVYSGIAEYTGYYPYVANNAAGDNWVHGVFFTP